jgi:hypothetical protein
MAAAHHDWGGARNCDTRVQLADSLVTYGLDPVTGSLVPKQVQIYSYDNNFNLTEVYFFNYPGRVNFYHQIFTYDSRNNLIRYVNQVWRNGSWDIDLINPKSYSTDGRILYEEFQRRNSSGVFAAYQRHYYNYSGDVITNYRRQVLDASGNWYDFSYHYYVYDASGRLTVLYGQYVNNGPVFWERTAVYGDNGLVTERYLRILRYNPVLKMNMLTNTSYQTYTYNIFGNVSETENYEWINQQWTYTGRNITYYSILKNKKVSVCHNGNSICIAAAAVEAHLSHGDKLGKCENDSDTEGKDERTDDKKYKTEGFILYPNPAKENVKIKINDPGNDYKTGVVMTSSGQVITSFDITGRSELQQDISSLRKGTYYIRLYHEEGFDTQMLIKK